MEKFGLEIRKKYFLPIIASVVAVLAACGLMACGTNTLTEDDIISMGYNIAVVYDYQGGKAGDVESLKVRIKEGSAVPEPGVTNRMPEVVRADYSLRDFCVAQKDENGELLRDENGNLVPGKVWDFKNDKATEDMTLMARWWPDYKVILHYGANRDFKGEIKYDLSKEGFITRQRDGSPNTLLNSFYSVAGYTFFEYYYDADGEQTAPTDGVFTADMFKDSPDGPYTELWGKSLEGNFRIIESADDLTGFVFGVNTSLYFEASVDASSIENFAFPAAYNGTILGNGHTISNLTVSYNSSDRSSDFGLFRALNASSRIADITFKNVTVNLDLNNRTVSEYNVGLFAGRIREGAEISNVTVDGTLRYKVVSGFDIREDLGKLTFNEDDPKVGVESGNASSGLTLGEVTVVGSKAIYTQDGGYAVYAEYTRAADGSETLGDVYGLCTVSNTRLTNVSGTVTKSGDTYRLTANNGTVYDITVALSNGVYSATVDQSDRADV